MTIDNYYKKMLEIYEHLQDEESRALFEMRITYILDGDREHFKEGICKLYQDWYFEKEVKEKVAKTNPEGIIMCGCGNVGKIFKRILPLFINKRKIYLFCDNYKAGEMIDGKKVLSIDEAIEDYKNYLFIICTYKYGEDIYKQLKNKEISDTNILWHKSKLLLLETRGKQYFDVFSPQRGGEVFVDAGSYNGLTIQDFLEWTNGNYNKIYAFEIQKEMCNLIQEMNIPRIKILNCAAWNKEEKLYFTEREASSKVNVSGEVEVTGLDIDSAVNGDKVTFIKMDIEGSELTALEGAKNTIIKNHPRLAICIYHEPVIDTIRIPAYILELVPEYKFYIRHYYLGIQETVLYAEV